MNYYHQMSFHTLCIHIDEVFHQYGCENELWVQKSILNHFYLVKKKRIKKKKEKVAITWVKVFPQLGSWHTYGLNKEGYSWSQMLYLVILPFICMNSDMSCQVRATTLYLGLLLTIVLQMFILYQMILNIQA